MKKSNKYETHERNYCYKERFHPVYTHCDTKHFLHA